MLVVYRQLHLPGIIAQNSDLLDTPAHRDPIWTPQIVCGFLAVGQSWGATLRLTGRSNC